jgi:hypothetical protein
MRKLLLILAMATTAYAETPETVITTYHPKAGKEAELLQVLRDAWSVYTKLNLVTGTHQLYRATPEGGAAYFVEIFTWRDEAIPDNAPPEVLKVWNAMRTTTDKLEFAEIKPVPDRPPTARKSPEPSRPSAAGTQ